MGAPDQNSGQYPSFNSPASGSSLSLQSVPRWGRTAKLLCICSLGAVHLLLLLSMASRHYVVPDSIDSFWTTDTSVVLEASPRGAADAASVTGALRAAVADLHQTLPRSSRFHALSVEQVVARLDRAMAVEVADARGAEGGRAPGTSGASRSAAGADATLGLERSVYCRLVALRAGEVLVDPEQSGIQFSAPYVTSETLQAGELAAAGWDEADDAHAGDGRVAPRELARERRGVVLTTYFASRMDPLRCTKHAGGSIPRDSFEYMRPWYLSIQRLGLSAVIFHDALSRAFTARLSTATIHFQHVRLFHHHWSLCDERWAVYRDWIDGGGADGLDYIIQTDISDTVVSRVPWPWFASPSAAGADLWVNVQRATDWTTRNYGDCYAPGSQPRALAARGDGDATVYNAGVVAGTRRGFAALAHAMTHEFDSVYATSGGAAYNCDMATLQSILTLPRFLEQHRVWNDGAPFCAGSIKCWRHGECSYLLYHK